MVDTPIVSEEFQRAYRNSFPSQTSSGRDLHVSDVIIPVVDFTPTASGASLPFPLQSCVNGNTSTTGSTTTQYRTSLNTNPSFYAVDMALTGDAFAQIAINPLGAAFPTGWITVKSIYYPNEFTSSNFYLFIPSGYVSTFDHYIASGTSNLTITMTPVADINGNLTAPFNYDPQ